MSIAAILQGKGGAVVQVRSTDSVQSAVQLLAEKRIGCVPVVDDGQVVGIFSERDLVTAWPATARLHSTIVSAMS